MQIIFYPLLFFSLIGHFSLGYMLTRRKYYALPIGLLFSGSIISILSRIVPLYTIEIILIIVSISTIIFFYKKLYIEVWNQINLKKSLYFFFAFVVFSVIFFKFHYKFIVYQSHESFYFAPSIELYLSEYFGNLRSLCKSFIYSSTKLIASFLSLKDSNIKFEILVFMFFSKIGTFISSI